MRKERLGTLTVRIAGGSDGEGGGDGPVVVLLHGFGAPGDDLVPLWRVLGAPAGTRFVFPEGPLELSGYGDGRAWWMVNLEPGRPRDRSREVPEGLAVARAAVEAMLGEVERTMHPTRLLIGGFSQGAMLSCDVALRSDRPLAGLVLLSGTRICEDDWRPRMAARAGLPALLSHGQVDPMLPFEQSERLRDELTEAGLAVTWVPFRGGHEIPGRVVDALGPFLRGALSEPGATA